MKILIGDELSPNALSKLNNLGMCITNVPDISAAELPQVIGDNEIIIVRSTKVTKATIEAGSALSLIIRAGAGVNTIDVETASQRGIHIANCPGKNSDAVAELAIGLLIAADRRIVSANIALQNGLWEKKQYGIARGLKGRTLGIVGVGNIGQAVIRRALALEMKVIAWSRSLTPERAVELGVEFCDSLVYLAQQADAISLHVAATPETTHLINNEFLSQMKPGAILINVARGEIIDTQALKAAIKQKKLRVALDVFENEPKGGSAVFDEPELAKLATCTPHIGASTAQAAEAIANEAINIVAAYKATGIPHNTVNIRSHSINQYKLVIRHYNKIGVLAAVLDKLRDQNINIEEMQNTIFNGGQAAVCILKLDCKPTKELLHYFNSTKHIILAKLMSK